MSSNQKIWFIHINNAPEGPYSADEIWLKLHENTIDYNSYIWKKDFKTWKKIEDEATFDQTPPEEPPEMLEVPPTLLIADKKKVEPGIWYLNENKTRSGPFKNSEVVEKIGKGVVKASTFIWKKGMTEWVPVQKSTEFKEYFEKSKNHKNPSPKAKDFMSEATGTPTSSTEKNVTSEMRKHIRAPLMARIIAHDNQDIAYMPCGNISEGGLFVFADKYLWDSGTQLKLNIKSEELPEAFNVEGTVIGYREDPQKGYNIKFSGLSRKYQRMLKEYVKKKAL